MQKTETKLDVKLVKRKTITAGGSFPKILILISLSSSPSCQSFSQLSNHDCGPNSLENLLDLPYNQEELLTSMLNSKSFAEEYRLRCHFEKALFDSTRVLSNNGGIRAEELDDISEALDRGPQPPLPKNDQEFAADDLHR